MNQPTTMPAPASVDGIADPSGNGGLKTLTFVHKDKLTWTIAMLPPGKSLEAGDDPTTFSFTKFLPATVPEWAYKRLIGRKERIHESGDVLVELFCAGVPEPAALETLPMPDQVVVLQQRVEELAGDQKKTVELLGRLVEGKSADGTLTMEGVEDPLAPVEARMEVLEAQQGQILKTLEKIAGQRTPAKPKKKRARRKTAKQKATAAAKAADKLPDAGAAEAAADAADSTA